jgi:flavin reductase (DIM6/NTAB) family NADH-FMN oxidoreductase RutF
MQFDFSAINGAERYKLMLNTVSPRPIAWVVTQDAAGICNAAPFSFFNAMMATPPILAIGVGPDLVRGEEKEKDTLRAIRETQEFVIAMVCESDVEAMNLTAAEAPRGVDELALAGIATSPASKVAPPLIASAPVNFECRLFQLIEPARNCAIVLGEIVAMHIDDRFVAEEGGKLRIDTPAMQLIARQFGFGGYVRGSDGFEVKRKTWPVEG